MGFQTTAKCLRLNCWYLQAFPFVFTFITWMEIFVFFPSGNFQITCSLVTLMYCYMLFKKLFKYCSNVSVLLFILNLEREVFKPQTEFWIRIVWDLPKWNLCSAVCLSFQPFCVHVKVQVLHDQLIRFQDKLMQAVLTWSLLISPPNLENKSLCTETSMKVTYFYVLSK